MGWGSHKEDDERDRQEGLDKLADDASSDDDSSDDDSSGDDQDKNDD